MQPGFGYPPRRSRLPLVVGVLGAVIVVLVAVVLVLALSGGDEDSGGAKASDGIGTGTGASVHTSTAPPATGVTYEISGTSPVPLDVVYAGTDGNDIDLTVSSLPWSITVDPAPDIVSFFALSTSIDYPTPDITLTLKRGAEVLKTCHGGGPCLTKFPS